MALLITMRSCKFPKVLQRRSTFLFPIILLAFILLETGEDDEEAKSVKDQTSEASSGEKRLPRCIIIGKCIEQQTRKISEYIDIVLRTKVSKCLKNSE